MLGIEPSSVILRLTHYSTILKYDAQKRNTIIGKNQGWWFRSDRDIHAKFKAMKGSWLSRLSSDKGHIRNFNLQNITFKYILKPNDTNAS